MVMGSFEYKQKTSRVLDNFGNTNDNSWMSRVFTE